MSDLNEALDRALAGGPERHHDKAREQGKLPVRERVARLLDDGSFAEEALLANWEGEGLGADGVVTGLGRIAGRPVAVMANDPTVKAGSWGPKTVEKIIRIQERALSLRVPMVYLVDSAGARITDQVQMFPGRRGAGKIFHTEVKLSRRRAAGLRALRPVGRRRRLHPRLLRRRDHARRQRLDVPRLAAHGRDGHRREGDARGDGRRAHAHRRQRLRPHAGQDRRGGHRPRQGLPVLLPLALGAGAAAGAARGARLGRRHPRPDPRRREQALRHQGADRRARRRRTRSSRSIRAGPRSSSSATRAWRGASIGIVANQPKQKGGVLFVDSADKAARFIQTCNAFNVPLLFLADVPGFMIGTAVERQGIIRHGAKMISAVSEATVPKLSVIVRKAYGAGLYAMAGPAFDPDACLALPTASIAVMGPQAAVNAVFYNQLQAIEDPDERARRTEELRREYAEDIDILHLASELVVDAVIQPEDLRDELVKRFALAAGKAREWPRKRNPITPALAPLGVGRARPERAGRRLVVVARRGARPAADRASRPARAARARGGASGSGSGSGSAPAAPAERVARGRLGRGRRRGRRAAERVAGGRRRRPGLRRRLGLGLGARAARGADSAAPPERRLGRGPRAAGSARGRRLGRGRAGREGRLALGRGVAARRHRGRVLGARGRRAEASAPNAGAGSTRAAAPLSSVKGGQSSVSSAKYAVRALLVAHAQRDHVLQALRLAPEDHDREPRDERAHLGHDLHRVGDDQDRDREDDPEEDLQAAVLRLRRPDVQVDRVGRRRVARERRVLVGEQAARSRRRASRSAAQPATKSYIPCG